MCGCDEPPVVFLCGGGGDIFLKYIYILKYMPYRYICKVGIIIYEYTIITDFVYEYIKYNISLSLSFHTTKIRCECDKSVFVIIFSEANNYGGVLLFTMSDHDAP